MKSICVKLSAALREPLAAEARRRNVTRSAIVRESFEQLLLADTAKRAWMQTLVSAGGGAGQPSRC